MKMKETNLRMSKHGPSKEKDLNKGVTSMLHMKQKYYNLEIVLELLKNESHLRGLSIKIGTNPMMVSRKLEELFSLNVVDYKMQGRNKVYFLKKTTEARLLVFMAEEYKLIKFLEKHSAIRRIIDKIQQNKKVRLALLFGSYAKNLETSKSDIDIYVETSDNKIKKDLERLDSKLSIKIGKYDENNLLIKEIEKAHIIIKGLENYYEKNKFFN
ncbi:MAG: nucleotidyltransferase domain-containing protein [Nanoarchaeota archaeon]